MRGNFCERTPRRDSEVGGELVRFRCKPHRGTLHGRKRSGSAIIPENSNPVVVRLDCRMHLLERYRRYPCFARRPGSWANRLPSARRRTVSRRASPLAGCQPEPSAIFGFERPLWTRGARRRHSGDYRRSFKLANTVLEMGRSCAQHLGNCCGTARSSSRAEWEACRSLANSSAGGGRNLFISTL